MFSVNMPTCGHKTSRGTPCRVHVQEAGQKCRIHREPEDGEPMCSVCMGPLRTRGARTLGCGHTFHKHCLERWKRTGNHTCPMCRAEFDPPRFKVTILLEPLEQVSQDILINRTLSGASAENLARTLGLQDGLGAEIRFLVEDEQELRDVLSDLGVLRQDLPSLDA